MIPKFGNAGFFICVNMLICVFSFPPMLLPAVRSVPPQIDAIILARPASDLALSGKGVTADGISYGEVILESGGLLIHSDWCNMQRGHVDADAGERRGRGRRSSTSHKTPKTPATRQERRERPAMSLPGLRGNCPADA